MDLTQKRIMGLAPDLGLSRVREFIRDRFSGKRIRIYEAGGGSMSILPLSSLDHPTISVVDIDEKQLQKNRYAEVKILGDIQSYSFPPSSFDLVVCNTVIEHLDHPDYAIRHFYDALVPGGVLFIGAPHPASFSGLVTKYSPHWFHVLYYRVILQQKNAGQPGEPPFPTVYHRIVDPSALIDFCEGLGFRLISYYELIGWSYYNIREKRPILGQLLYRLISLMNILTLGKRDLRNGDYYVIFEKSGETVDKRAAQIQLQP